MALPTALAGAVALAIALVMAWPGKMWQPYVILCLVMTGGAGVIEGLAGGWLRDKMGDLASKAREGLNGIEGSVDSTEIQSVIALVSAGLLHILGVIVIGYLIFRVKEKAIDGRTLALALVAPVVVRLVPGWGGEALTWVLSVPPAIGGGVISAVFGV